MKLLMLFFSFINFFSSDFNKKEADIKSSYELVSSIEYIFDKYVVIERNEKIEIMYNESRIDLINNIYHYEVIHFDDTLVVFYKNTKNDYVNILKYSKGKFASNYLIENKLKGVFDVVYINNSYILVSTIDEYENDIIYNEYLCKTYLQKQNGIILQLDNNFKILECKIYGGELNDCFEKIYFDYQNEIVYISGKKDQNTGYDFGNGGNGVSGYILCVIDDNLDLVDYIILDNRITNVEISEKIRIFTVFDCFLVNEDLSAISSLSFESESLFGVGMGKSWVAIFMRAEVKFYDFDRNILLCEYQYQDIEDLQRVEIIDDYLIIQGTGVIARGVFYNDLFSEKIFIYDDLKLYDVNTEVLGIPNNFKLKEITYEQNFNPSIFGDYEMYLNYDKFIITSKIRVLERCNITDGYIYPTGYSVLFSGTAYLNGEEIFNNYSINTEGKHSLKLVGKDSEKIINFQIYNMDILFEEELLKNWDYEVRKNQNIIIKFSYNHNMNITKIIINNESYDFDDDKENHTITLSISNSEIGMFEYLINEIVYEKDNKLYTKEINYYFKVKVLLDKMSLNNSFYNDDENFVFDIKLDNSLNQLRAMKIVSDKKTIYIPIKEGNIKIEEFNELENIKLFLVYDVLGKLYEEQLLFELKYDFNKSNVLGAMELKNTNSDLENIILKIPISRNLKTIVVNDEVKYQYNQTNTYYLIFYSLIFVVGVFIVYEFIKKRKEKKNKK